MTEATRGLFFEDFEIGSTMASPARTITEADVVAFAGLSGDYNPLHTDEEYAKGTMFGGRIAHGLLVLSIASGLASRLGFLEGTVLAFLGLDWKFREPVRAGDTVHVEATIAAKKAMPRLGGGIVDIAMDVKNQKGAVAQKGTWRLLVRLRGSD